MRKLLSDVFSAESDFIVDTARNGKDALDKIKRFKPDLITMDVEMPVMDGLTALEIIMRENPTPVVMVSSLTRDGAEATMKALDLGAVDFVAKTAGPISSVAGIGTEIINKCRAAAQVNVQTLRRKPFSAAPATSRPVASPTPLVVKTPEYPAVSEERIVAIGTSTGGPRALQEIITKLPGNLPCGVVVVQHMPPGFTKSLSERLNSLSSVTVKEAEHNDVIKPGLVLIAPGDYHMTVEIEGGRKVVKLAQNPPIGGHRPAVDPMLESVARVYGAKAVGVILTGMGHDGAKGMQTIRQQKGYTIAEDQSTSVVFGMPKAAIELGVIDKVLPLPAIASEIVRSLAK